MSIELTREELDCYITDLDRIIDLKDKEILRLIEENTRLRERLLEISLKAIEQ